MSAGTFDRVKYQADDARGGGIYRMRVQSETLGLTDGTLTNSEPTGDVDQRIRAKVSKTRREIGLGPRKLLLAFTGVLPDTYSGDSVLVPILTPATFAAWSVEGTELTYLNVPVEVIGSVSEDLN